jgi:hypothetical protein
VAVRRADSAAPTIEAMPALPAWSSNARLGRRREWPHAEIGL